jgi:hypothetical protein
MCMTWADPGLEKAKPHVPFVLLAAKMASKVDKTAADGPSAKKRETLNRGYGRAIAFASRSSEKRRSSFGFEVPDASTITGNYDVFTREACNAPPQSPYVYYWHAGP